METVRLLPIVNEIPRFKINSIDEKFDNMVESGLKSGKIRRCKYVPMKCHEPAVFSVVDETIHIIPPKEENKVLYVVENGAIDKMLKSNGVNVFE